MERGNGKEVKTDIAEQKNKLITLSKALTKKINAAEKLSRTQYMQIKQTIKLSNGIGLRMIEKQQSAEALDMLKQVESVTLSLLRIVEQSTSTPSAEHVSPVLKLLANTYNNIAYLFSQAGNLENAYSYLLRTLDAETRGEYSNYRKGLTCLNISNLLIKMQKYKETSKFANRAIEEFQAALGSSEDLDSPDKLGKQKKNSYLLTTQLLWSPARSLGMKMPIIFIKKLLSSLKSYSDHLINALKIINTSLKSYLGLQLLRSTTLSLKG